MSSNNDEDSNMETCVADSGKKLSELKVIELRSELEKRSLDKTGVKAVLMERLEKALESEGKVSADYLFTEDELKTKKSTGRLYKGAVEKEVKDEEDEDEEYEDASQSITTDDKSVDEPNNLSGNSEIKNCEKSTDVALSVDDDKTEVQGIISTEEPISSEETPKTPVNDMDGKDTNSPVKTAPISTDPPALPPPQSSSTPLKDVNTKEEEDEPKDADKPAVASTQEDQSDEAKQDDVAPAPTATTDDKKKDDEEKKEEKDPVSDLLPPSPTSVPCVAPLTLKDTISMDTSSAQQNEENESLIVHVDDTQNDLDADLLTSRANGLKLRQAAKEKAIGKTEGNKSDVGSDPPEAGSETGGGGGGSVGVSGDKGSMDDAKKTEKNPDEKKDEKIDGKLKSSPVSKLKVVKGDNQNSRNLWISGLSSTTQAADVKEAFSKYGKVVVVKIVTNLRTPGAENRAFLTMSSSEEAAKCIQHLNQTELQGKKMSISMAKNNLTSQTKSGEKKTVVKQGAGQNSRNLWVSGLSSNTRATDLKSLFSKYGKVVDAKVVTNVRSPGARCYGFLTMYSSEEASKCIQHLNQTELHGKMISVEKAKNDPGLQSVKKTEAKPEVKKDKKEVEKKEGDKKEGVKKEVEKKDEKDRRPVSRRDDRRHSSSASRRRPLDKSRSDRSKEAMKRRSKEDAGTDKIKTSADKDATTPKGKSKDSPTDKKKESKKDVLSFDQIRAERERERIRQSQRRLREDQRLEEIGRAREMQRDFQRRQKDEAMRLAKSLSMERAKLERVKLESERIKLEREYLVQERIRTEQRREEILRFEEQKRRALKRSYERGNAQNEDGYWNEPKRATINTPSNRFEHGFTNESRFNEFEPRDYERRVERYDRREARSLDNTAASRFDERKDRDLGRRDIGPAREMRDRDDRFDRRDVGPSRDRSNDRNHDRRDLGPDRGRDSDRRNISAHDRLGRVRNSPAVSQPPPPPTSDHRTHWGSGYVGGSGGGSGSGGMVQNMGHNLTYVNPNAQSSSMVGGSNNMGGRMQEPRFDAYMQRY